MRYSSNNLEVSFSIAAAEKLLAEGYDIYWYLTDEIQLNTKGAVPAKGTITFVDDIPAVPESIVRLKSGSSLSELGPGEVPVPCLTLQIPAEPSEEERLGLGHKEFYWNTEFRLDGFAEDAFQQQELASLFRTWLRKGDTVAVQDYDSDPVNPPSLRPAEVKWVSVDRPELIHEVDAIRYYISLQVGVEFIE